MEQKITLLEETLFNMCFPHTNQSLIHLRTFFLIYACQHISSECRSRLFYTPPPPTPSQNITHHKSLMDLPIDAKTVFEHFQIGGQMIIYKRMCFHLNWF